MLTLTQSTWQNEYDQTIYRVHQKHENEKAAIGFVHGLGEHIHRYEHVFETFAAQGYSIYGFDSVGHGRSEGKKGHVNSLLQWMNELEMLYTWMRETTNKPIVFYGHSLGGFKSLIYSLQGGNLPEALIVTSPFLGEANPSSGLKIAVGKFASNFAPKFILPNGLDIDCLSRKKDVVNAYLADELIHANISLKMASVIFSGAAWIMDASNHKLAVPALIQHGDHDGITDFTCTETFATTVQGEINWKAWEGGFHELHNDSISEEMLTYTSQWLSQTISGITSK